MIGLLAVSYLSHDKDRGWIMYSEIKPYGLNGLITPTDLVQRKFFAAM